MEDRCIKVEIGNAHSHNEIIQTGVPQGGVLSSTLFSLASTRGSKCSNEGIVPNTAFILVS